MVFIFPFLFSTPNTIGIICGGFHNKDTLPINKNLLLCKRRHDSQNVQAQFEHDDIMIHPGKIVLFFTAMDPIISMYLINTTLLFQNIDRICIKKTNFSIMI